MNAPITVQRILDRFADPGTLDPRCRQVCRHLQTCRTAVLGGRWLRCDRCEAQQCWHHSCRDRHCPQCQGQASRQWAQRQRDRLLPVRYYHLVFTLPHDLNGWVHLHPEVIYRLLFEATWGTLKAFGRDPKRLGGELGMSAVLHTWGQNLTRHVHLHCLVPGGVLDDNHQWRATQGNYLFPVRALSRHFRGRMVGLLRRAATRGELHRVTRPGDIDTVLDTLMAKPWVVYTKHCLNHTGTVVDYLARYTHRIAITNARLLKLDQRCVTFRVKDYRDGGRHKNLCLDGEVFVQRFLLHVLPKGLMRIRHYGFLANRCHRDKLGRIRRALAAPPPQTTSDTVDTAPSGYPCPRCRRGTLRVVATLAPQPPTWAPPG